jgi:amidase
MKKPARRAGAAVSGTAPPELRLEHAPMSDIIDALAGGQVSASALAKTYLARIAAYDRAGPALNAVRALNPDALTIAASSTASGRRPGGRWRACRSC